MNTIRTRDRDKDRTAHEKKHEKEKERRTYQKDSGKCCNTTRSSRSKWGTDEFKGTEEIQRTIFSNKD